MWARAVSVGGAVLILALAGGSIAIAASVSISAGRLGAGSASIAACDANGFSYGPTIDTSGRITSITVSGIDTGCAGATLRVTLTSGTTDVATGSGSLPSSGFTGSAVVTVSPNPLSTAVNRIYGIAEGP